jgi:FkbM family methyltransferase
MRTFPEFFQHLRGLGFAPRTLIDVGVAWGTPDLYNGFPGAYLILFEALPIFENAVQKIIDRRPGEYHLVALADFTGTRRILVGSSVLQKAGASIFRTSGDHIAPEQTEFEVVVDTLDARLAERAFALPALLKIDAQEADILVAKGAERTLRNIEVVIMETTLFPFSNPGNQVRDVIGYMGSIGFVLYDIVGSVNRPFDDALGQMDLAFVHENGPFRKHANIW